MVRLIVMRWIKQKCILSNNELGKMKDEITNDTNIEARLPIAKANRCTTLKGEVGKKLKGITKATIENPVTIEEYINAIHNCKSKHVTNYSIDSKKHH